MIVYPATQEQRIHERYGDSLLGCHIIGNVTIFRVYCPRSPKVELELFDLPTQSSGKRYAMTMDVHGIWECYINDNLTGKLYGYRVSPPSNGLPFEVSDFPVADPYSRWAVCRNNYQQYPLSYIFEPETFDWQSDDFVAPSDPRDLVIYEAHIKDLVGASATKDGTRNVYEHFLDGDIEGGIAYLKELGVNAIEFLPLHKFAYTEPPYKIPTPDQVTNSWNPYALNYWGYMTTFFFMPESLFAHAGSPADGQWYGSHPKGINLLKSIIRELHKAGISVILDVVYNHISQYDRNPLRYLDSACYLRYDGHRLRSDSGCGNDMRTESPMARKLIIDSVLYWMREFHIDGFRFDLANLIDRETLIRIREESRKVNPNVVLIAEPWGGGYNPTGFSEIGWSSWNDQIRNGVKGSDPIGDPGFIFGRWQHGTTRLALENFLRGTLLNGHNGRFLKPIHSVNYLESHDGYTLGDFIRIAFDHSLRARRFSDPTEIVTLEGNELNVARLGALYLMVAQGVVMIHAGQEFARCKVIRRLNLEDPESGQMDHNSYNKDNETNYLDYRHLEKNQALVDFYKGLIKLRLSAAALRKADPGGIHFRSYEDPLHLTFMIGNHGTTDPYEYLISLNGNHTCNAMITLPDGDWDLMVSQTVASDTPISVIKGDVQVPAISGLVARRLRQGKT